MAVRPRIFREIEKLRDKIQASELGQSVKRVAERPVKVDSPAGRAFLNMTKRSAPLVENPQRLLTEGILSSKARAVPTFSRFGQAGEDVGYGVRGAFSITPFQTFGLGKTGQAERAYAPTTPRQQTAERIGRAVYGTGLTAGLGGPNIAANITSRALQGAALGTGLTTAGTLVSSGLKGDVRLPTKQELKLGALSGLENSWQLALTNQATDMALTKLGKAHLVGKGITEPFTNSQLKEGWRRVITRALAEVPAENTFFTLVDKLSGEEKAGFLEAFARNLPGNIAGNLLFAAGQGALGTYKFQANEKRLIEEARKKALFDTMFDKDFKRIRFPEERARILARTRSIYRDSPDPLFDLNKRIDKTDRAAIQGILERYRAKGEIDKADLEDVTELGNKYLSKEIKQLSRAPREFIVEELSKHISQEYKSTIDVKTPKIKGEDDAQNGDLLSEARKYKSAEEFVKAQPKLFHGSKSSFDRFDISKAGTGEGSDIFGDAAYLTDSRQLADFYAKATAKKDFIAEYRPTGIFGTDEPVYRPGADELAKQNAVVNEFVPDNLKLLDAGSYKISPEVKNILIEGAEARGFDASDVNRYIEYASKNNQKINNYRGELPYLLQQIPLSTDTPNKLASFFKKQGYDGVKYLSDASYEGSGGYNYAIFNPEKLLSKSQLTDIYNQAKSAQGGLSEPKGKLTQEFKSEIDGPTPQIKQEVDARYPDPIAKLPDDSPVKKVITALQEAEPVRKSQESLYSKERSRRLAIAASQGERIPGEKGYIAQLGALKGELPKADYEGIRKQLKQKDVDQLFDMVEESNLPAFQKITAKNGLAKMLRGEVPTKGEINLMREVYPDEMIGAILDKRGVFKKMGDLALDIANVPRSIMASTDLSAPLRQGAFLIGRPKQWIPALREMFKYAFSDEAYKQGMDDIRAKPLYEEMEKQGLALTDMKSLSTREEAFMSGMAERIPGYGKVIEGSNRAYSGFLNQLRANVFEDLVKTAKEQDTYSDEVGKNLAEYVNAATGRGELPKVFEGSAPLLNSVFFSPRLVMSRLNLMNPVKYMQMDSFTRKEALKDALKFGGTAMSLMTLAKLGGADVEEDPRNADFGKIKFDNTRYDILAGFQQPIRALAQMITGEKISSTTGRLTTLGEGYKPLTRLDIASQFLQSKQAPLVSLFTDLFKGVDFQGKKVDVPEALLSRMMPMVIQDIYDLYQENDDLGQAIVMGWPAIFGVGTQTYGQQEYVTGENVIGQPVGQIRPLPGLAERIRAKTLGEQPLGSTAGWSVTAFVDQLNEMDPEQAKQTYQFIKETDPEVAKKIEKEVKDRLKGITIEDKSLKTKGVASGDRALEIAEQLNKLETPEEKKTLWQDYTRKGIITDDVAEQLRELARQGRIQ